jgi:Cu/Ag efflux pump CusA
MIGKPKRGEGSTKSKPAVILGIRSSRARRLQELMPCSTTSGNYPPGSRLTTHLRQADFIEIAIHNVLGRCVMAAWSWHRAPLLGQRPRTFITLTAIPLSLLATILVMKSFGATINTMTLGGMAIAIGALVDDAVILVENVFRRLRVNSLHPEDKRKKTMQVIFDASIEIQKSIVFATLIIALVFLPIFFLSGVEGRLLKPLVSPYRLMNLPARRTHRVAGAVSPPPPARRAEGKEPQAPG